MKVLAIFDFDGTLTHKDSFLEFIRYDKGRFRFYTGLLILFPVLVLYALKLISNSRAKYLVFSYFFKGTPLNEFNTVANDFCMHHLDAIIRRDAWEALEKHKKMGHTVCIVTATPESIIHSWCTYHGVHCIGTLLGSDDGILNGKFASKNCYGKEKVTRIKQVYSLAGFNEIHVYGDSRGDKELLSIATHKNFRIFKSR
jgi:HAD superfamily hydrolase (TIGR01490 family)